VRFFTRLLGGGGEGERPAATQDSHLREFLHVVQQVAHSARGDTAEVEGLCLPEARIHDQVLS
jgi:hypothetical protein